MKKISIIYAVCIAIITPISASSFVEEKKAFFERNKHLDGYVEYFALTSIERELISVEYAHECRMGLYSMEDEDYKTQDKKEKIIAVRDNRMKWWNNIKKEIPVGSYLIDVKFTDTKNALSFSGYILLINGDTVILDGGSIIPGGTEFSIK